MKLKTINIDKQRLLSLLGIVLASAIVVAGTTWYIMDKNAREIKEANDKQIQEMQKQLDALNKVSKNEPDNADNKTGDELISLDETYNLYKNYDNGFEIKIPKQAYFSNASCEYSTADGDHSYRPKEGFVPVKVIPDGNVVYITMESGAQLTGESTSNNISYFSSCEKVNVTLDLLKQNTWWATNWKITTENINNDEKLISSIQKGFGSGCGLGEMKTTNQENTFNVTIKGDGLDLETTKCPINYMTALFYNQVKSRFSHWGMGQAYSFYTEGFSDGYDSMMKDSFRFI